MLFLIKSLKKDLSMTRELSFLVHAVIVIHLLRNRRDKISFNIHDYS